jgi:regulator of protease activity HflC (stomatin/prohibitin superfamily)
MILVLVVIFFWNNIVYTIKPGEVGVLFRRFAEGTVIDRTYQEGLTILFPWNLLYKYDTRVQQHAHEMTALTKEGLTVDLQLSIRYYPERTAVGMLHLRVGADYLNKVIIPEVESNIRKEVGHLTVDQMYTPDPAMLQKLVNEMAEKMEQNYIVIQDVAILRVKMPKTIEAAVEKKIENKQLVESYQYRLAAEKLEAQRKETEAGGIQVFNQRINASITPNILKWQGIQATIALSTSNNSKIVVVGTNSKEMPIILGSDAVVEAPKPAK